MAGEIKTLQFADGVETGEPSSLPLGPLDSHSDVDTTGANNGDALVYDASESKWVPGAGGGGGLGAVNFNTNPNATAGADLDDANDIGDYVASGTGVTVAQATTGLPMGSLRTTGIQLTLATGTADYVRLRFRVPETYRGMINQIAWRQALDSFVAGTAKVELYSYSDAYANGETQVNLLYRDSNGESLIKNAPEFYEEFLADATREYYELRIVNDGATAGTLTLNDVVIGPDTRIMGAVVSEEIDFTPVLLWTTNATATGKYWQSGNRMSGWIKVSLSGAPNSASLAFDIPDGLTIDTEALGNADTLDSRHGEALLVDASVPSRQPGLLRLSSSTRIAVAYLRDNSPGIDTASVTQAVPIAWENGDSVYISFKDIPILEWRGKGTTQMLTQGHLYANAHLYGTFGATALSNSTTIIPSDISISEQEGLDWDAVNAKATIKADGRYRLSLSVQINTSATENSYTFLEWRKNGSSTSDRLFLASVIRDSSNSSAITSSSTEAALSAGDVLYLRMTSSSSTGSTNATSDNSLSFSISRISDYTHGTGVGLGPATADNPGLVGTEAQTWAGTKTVEAIRSGVLSPVVSSGSPSGNIFTPIVGQQYMVFAMSIGGASQNYHAVALVGNWSSSGAVLIHHLSNDTLTFVSNSGSVRLESSDSSPTTVRITWIRLN